MHSDIFLAPPRKFSGSKLRNLPRYSTSLAFETEQHYRKSNISTLSDDELRCDWHI